MTKILERLDAHVAAAVPGSEVVEVGTPSLQPSVYSASTLACPYAFSSPFCLESCLLPSVSTVSGLNPAHGDQVQLCKLCIPEAVSEGV